jgi:glycosyltransferase involved in cell wall biosynthesis
LKSEPKITVLMTVYNAGGFLKDSVGSILEQTFGDFEFLIVDDASTDGSADRLDAWARCDSRIRFLRQQKNAGQTASLNLGLQEAKTDWILRMDADDISLPHRIEKLWNAALGPGRPVLVGSRGWILDTQNRVTGTINVPLSDRGIRWAMPFQNPFLHAAVLFRRSLPGVSVAYDERFRICQDWDLWRRISDHGPVCNLPDRLIGYRHHDSSLSHASSTRTREEAGRIACTAFSCLFGRSPSEEEKSLLEQFREGLPAGSARRFWLWYQQMDGFPPRSDAAARALHQITYAGACMGRGENGWWRPLLQAFREAPLYTMGIVCDRLRLPAELTIKEKSRLLAEKKE